MADTVGSNLTPVQRFWRLLKPDRKEIRNVYIYSIFAGLVNLSLPLGIQAIINLIQGGQISTSWVVLVSVVVLGVAITGILQITQLRITENLQQKIFTRAAFEFTHRVPRIKMEALYQKYAPELMNRFFDIISIQKGLSKILIDLSVAILNVVFGLVLLSFYHPFFIAFSLVLVLLVYAILRFTLKRGLKTSLMESKYKYKVVHWLEELARSNTTFKLSGTSELPMERTDQNAGNYLKARESHFRILVQQYSLMIVFKVIVALGLLAIGGVLVMNAQMNIGQFVAAEIIILLVMSSVEKMILSLETIYDVMTGLEKVGQVTDLDLEQNEGFDCLVTGYENGMAVNLDQVRFSFPGGNKDILKDIDLSLGSGEKLLITGPNGSGKSTLMMILAGLYDVQKGQISYNGLPKGNLDMGALRSAFGNSLSSEQIFEGTLLENITMNRADAPFENVQWAVENLDLGNYIRSLADGYNTPLSAQGKGLPKGIIQKILLARSIVDKPKLLLLESALASIQESDRRRIIDFLTSPEHKWSMVIVSSDPYVAQKVDRWVVMEDGRITDMGLRAD
jgi:ABC-type bacteriocin/lantibiotic exporter with double-glycine peptidase domain